MNTSDESDMEWGVNPVSRATELNARIGLATIISTICSADPGDLSVLVVVAHFVVLVLVAVELVALMVNAFDEFANRCIALCFLGWLSVCWDCTVFLYEHLGNAGACREFITLMALIPLRETLSIVVIDLTNKEVTLISLGIEFVAVERLSFASVSVFVHTVEFVHGSGLHVDNEFTCAVWEATGVPHAEVGTATFTGARFVPRALFTCTRVLLNSIFEADCRAGSTSR